MQDEIELLPLSRIPFLFIQSLLCKLRHSSPVELFHSLLYLFLSCSSFTFFNCNQRKHIPFILVVELNTTLNEGTKLGLLLFLLLLNNQLLTL